MCSFKSMLILKDMVFVPDYDSHDKMLEELGIEDTRANAERLFVRVELTPADGDPFSDISTWKYNVDQDILPEWYVKEVDKRRAIDAVKEWAKEHIYVGQDNLKIESDTGYYLKDCKNVTVRGNATVKAYGNATVKAYNNATVAACGSATVKAWDNATVTAYDNTTVEAYGNAMVYNSPLSSLKWHKKDSIILRDDAIFKDNETKTIYQAGDWELVLVDKKDEV